MTDTEKPALNSASVDEMQKGWHELTLRVAQLEAEKRSIEQELKAARRMLELLTEHRQKSHGELVLLLTSLVSKLPLNDVGVIISRLVEHNNNVSHFLSGLVKGTPETDLSQPAALLSWEQTKRELHNAIQPLVEELLKLEPPLETESLKNLSADPESFFS